MHLLLWPTISEAHPCCQLSAALPALCFCRRRLGCRTCVR